MNEDSVARPTGDPVAPGPTDELIARSIDGVYSLLLRMLGHKEDAEDRTQEVFRRVIRSFPTYRGEAKPSTWIFRIAINVGRDAIAERQRTRGREAGEVDPNLHRAPDDPAGDAVASEERRLLIAALERLPGEKREIILLADMEGLGTEEIAEALGIPSGTVKSRLHRARAALRDEVRGSMGGES